MIAREIARNIARANMKDAGFVHVNKKKYDKGGDGRGRKSYFSLHWREWIKRV